MEKFIDEIKIIIVSGSGGNGIASFRREARVPFGGPDGGDGGDGGDIYFKGDPNYHTLFHLKNKKIISAKNGTDGRRKKMHGKNGDPLTIKVPLGTMVYEYNTHKLIADIIDEESYLIAKGGTGGKGNTRFKSSINTVPKIFEKGLPGKKIEIFLSLKFLANVGLIGLPSVGKSTIFKKMTNATPKIADYPFTTLMPQLGIINNSSEDLIMADLPGLIKNAHLGKGLGIQFLKHIERCQIICHVVDMGSENINPILNYQLTINELKEFSKSILKKPEIVIANKSDLPSFQTHYKEFVKFYPNKKIISISALKNFDQHELKQKIEHEFIKSKTNLIITDETQGEITIELADDIIIEEIGGAFKLSGSKIENIYNRITFDSPQSLTYFKIKLKKIGIFKMLKRKKIVKGNKVVVFNHSFIWDED